MTIINCIRTQIFNTTNAKVWYFNILQEGADYD